MPLGVRDYLPEAAARRRAIAKALLSEFDRWGYRRIVTPAFEYEWVLARGLGPGARSQAVRFVEPGTGEVVMLRPDITPQVARLAATRLASEPGPIRLSYQGAVIRLSHGGQREMFQAGVELVGAPSPAGDVEVIALGAAALQAAGVVDYALDLGEASLVRLALAGLTPAEVEAARVAVARKDCEDAERVSRTLRLSPWRRKLLAALPSLYGGPEVIERADALLRDGRRPETEAAHQGLRELRIVVERLGGYGLAERLSIDLGEVRGFDYYTGVRFQGFAPGVGDALLSGGRYDHLIERYGRSAGAAGFAVDVERVALALPERPAAPAGIYLAGPPAIRTQLAGRLRLSGARVCEDLDEPLAAESLLLERARAVGAERLLCLDKRGVLVIDLHGGRARIARPALTAALTGAGSLDAFLPARYAAAPQRG